MAGAKNYQKADVIARLFGKTVRRIQQLTQDGILPTEQTPDGRRYDLLPTITRYIKYLEARAEKQQPQSMTQKLEAKLDAEIKYKKAKADKAKLELDELKGKKFEGNIFDVIKRHIEVLRKYYDESWLTLYMRKHLLWYVSGVEKASAIRLQLATSPSIDNSLELLEKIFNK